LWGIVLIGHPITIIIDTIAGGIIPSGFSRCAGVLFPTVNADGLSRVSTGALTADHRLTNKILICERIAVIIDTITGGIIIGGIPRRTAVLDLSSDTESDPLSEAVPHTTLGALAQIIFIILSIAVIISTITAGIITGGLSRHTAVGQDPLDAEGAALGETLSSTTFCLLKEEVLVADPVTVIIDVVAGGVIVRRMKRSAGV